MGIVSRQAEAKSTRDEALDIMQAEYERVNAELRDIKAKLDQSRGQVEQLAQRNSQVVGEVRRIESTLEETPRLTIKETYTEALETQQRLLNIRSQREKLEAQELVARQEADALTRAIAALSSTGSSKGGGRAGVSDREMIIRIIDAQEAERERLANSMHDGPAQSLSNFILQAEIVQKLFEKNPDKAREELSGLKNAAGDAFQRVRQFIFNLRPMMLTDLGLVPTVKRFLAAFEEQAGIQTEFVMNGRDRRMEGYREVLIFRGIQELLTNSRDQASTSVKVAIEMGDDRVLAVVEDNGRGYGTGRLTLETAGQIPLSALQERITLVDGELHIGSTSGMGSRIEFSIPLGPEPSDQREGDY